MSTTAVEVVFSKMHSNGLARDASISVDNRRAVDMISPGHEFPELDIGHHIAWANRAVLLVDIVESVRLMEQNEASVISRWLNFVGFVKGQILPQFSGHFVKSLGDGMLLDFEDVRSGVAASLTIQEGSKRVNVGIPAEEQILLRMGMEVSNVVIEIDDILGRGVNLAARLMTLAGPGEIIISQHVRDRLTPALDAEIEDLGECFLRHLKEPVRAYRIGPPGPRPWIKHVLSLDDLAPAIAVVPFAPRHVQGARHIIGDVLAEEIIRKLSRLPDLTVISRLSTAAFRGRNAPSSEIAAYLGADYVLSGAYRSDEHDVVLDVELAESKSGRVLWTEHLTDNIAGILTGEQELVSRAAAGVARAVVTRELQRSQLQPLPTLKAYTLLMAAIALMYRLSLADFEEAHRLLQALLERGARQPIASAWMANWHVLRVQQGWSDNPRLDAQVALDFTKRALDADPDCSLAFAIKGFVHTNLLKDFDIALECYGSALATNPSNALAWLLKGTLHAFRSEGQVAVEHTERALSLSPLDPHRYFYDSLSATACVAARHYDRALELAQRSLRANCMHTSTLRVLTAAHWHLGQHKEARKAAQQLLKLEPSLTVSGWLERSPAAPYPVGQETAEALRGAGVPN
jgi:adenylate cyclase